MALDLSDLADSCQALAEDLDSEQQALSYAGAQAVTLGKLSASLSAEATILRTIAVSNEIASSADAVAALSGATDAANEAVSKLKDAAAAIQIAGLVLSVVAGIISEKPSAIVSSGKDLIAAVRGLS